ncbi:transposable element Tcb2 transposase [Trichonephila clavipes]|nr:transposable element Tcb2 transposase [Trichonephila clavipes]
MEAEGSARRVARQLGHSDCVMRRCWDQWIREMSFTQIPGSRRPRQTIHREDRHIVRNARVHPTASSAAIQAQVAPSIGVSVSSRTVPRCLAEGQLGLWCPIRLRLEWCRARENWTAADWNQFIFSDARARANPDLISAVMTIVFVCGDPEGNDSILLCFTSIHHSHSWCDSMGCHCL